MAVDGSRSGDLAGRRCIAPCEADWRPMLVGDRALSGVTMHMLSETPGYWRSYWMKMEAGARSVMHRHCATELLTVLEGSVTDCDGRVFGAADVVVYPSGTRHLLWSPGGCMLLVIESEEATLA